MLADGSKSFHAAARLLPDRVRGPATVFYAFCRLADDAVDHASDSAEALGHLRERLTRVYAGNPLDQPVDRAFADLVAHYPLPKAVVDLLFEGFEWDASGRFYDSIEEVRAYGVRVAGTVGVIMALLMGVRDPAVLARACDLGIAMQLTNIARDVGEDANAARLYLPRAWLIEEGLDPEVFLARPEMSAALGRVIARLLAEADRLYRRGEVGIAALPGPCRPAIAAARLIYADIGRVIAANGHDSVSVRAVVPSRRKLMLMARALSFQRSDGAMLTAQPLAEARPLLAAAAVDRAPPAARFDTRVAWVVALLQRQARRAGMMPPARR